MEGAGGERNSPSGLKKFPTGFTSFTAALEKRLAQEPNSEGRPVFEVHPWEKLSPFYNVARMIDVMTSSSKLMLIAIVLISITNVMIMGGLRADTGDRHDRGHRDPAGNHPRHVRDRGLLPRHRGGGHRSRRRDRGGRRHQPVPDHLRFGMQQGPGPAGNDRGPAEPAHDIHNGDHRGR